MQTKHSGTHQVDIIVEFQNKLQTHIQMIIGRQRDMSNRLLALERLLQSNKSSKLKHHRALRTEEDMGNPSSLQHAEEEALEWSDSYMEQQKDSTKRDTTHMSRSASSWEGQPTQIG